MYKIKEYAVKRYFILNSQLKKSTINLRDFAMKDDEFFMQQALLEAVHAKEKGEVPVGAVLVADKKIFSRGFNSTVEKNDPTSHAEIEAIRKACELKSNYRLPNCDLYVTLEPCAMCLGAAVQARIRRYTG